MAAPAPPSIGLSRLATLNLLRKDPIGMLERAAAAGDVVSVPTPRFSTFVLNRPDLVWDVLATGNHDFKKGPTMQVAKRLIGENLLTSEGEVHKRQRRLIQPIFHHERIAAYAAQMVGLGERAMSRWVRIRRSTSTRRWRASPSPSSGGRCSTPTSRRERRGR